MSMLSRVLNSSNQLLNVLVDSTFFMHSKVLKEWINILF